MGGCAKDTGNTHMGLKLLRDSSNIGELLNICQTGDTSELRIGDATVQKLDSPATTSAITYKLQFKSTGGVAQVRICMNNSDASIACMEIDGT